MTTFANWIRSEKLTHEKAARLLQVSRPFISQILAGKKKPSLKLIKKIVAVSDGKVTAHAMINDYGGCDVG
tara:strand:+ start:355 stop:567 length:213 start_codon:yes stop_codon:yes gene_type:complete